MKTVNELNENELEELRETFYLQLLDGAEVLGNDDLIKYIDSPGGIPMSDVIAHYEGTYFVEEDFFCNI